MDFSKLGRKVIEKSTEAFSKYEHLLAWLHQREIRISQDMLNEGVQRAALANSGISGIEIECLEGRVRVSLNVRSLNLLEHTLVLDFCVEHFILSASEQYAQLRFNEGAIPEAKNWSASVANWFADVSVDKLMTDPKRAAEIESKTNGLVALDWPIARIHLDRHKSIKIIKRSGVLSRVEFVKCDVIPGFLVFPITKVTNEVVSNNYE